jgi:hypothetical protein
VRNSSLVKCFCAENSAGLKHITEAVDYILNMMVEERSVRTEAQLENWVDFTEVIMPV